MAFRVTRPDEVEWIEREPEPGGSARYVARLSDELGFQHTRGNLWRYPAGARGRRHRDTIQEETFVVVAGTLTVYLGEPPEQVEVPQGGVVHVEAGTELQLANQGDEEVLLWAYGAPPEAGTELQLANHGDEEVLLWAYGAPPEAGGAEFLDSAV